MLEFLLGTDEREKMPEIYRRADADAKSGRQVFILVPEQYSMYAEQELLTALGLSAQNKIQILTFSRLSNLIFSKLGPLRTKYIDKAGKYLIACRAMQLCRNELKFFSRNLHQPGFANLITSAISEFKRYGITPERLNDAAKDTDNVILSEKLFDFSIIYSKFNELIAESWSNAEDNLSLALHKIPDADFLSGSLYISYFKSFTPVEYQVITCLLQKMDVCVSVCTDSTDSSSMVFSSQIATFYKLTAIANELGIKTKKPIFVQDNCNDTIPAELTHLKENYFAARPLAMPQNPDFIHAIRPQNRYSEVQHAARLIKRLCRTKGYSLNDFLILTGSVDAYELILPSIFEEYDINYFLDQKIRLAESPFMRMILALLEILAFGFSYERIMTILRSGFWGISKCDADIFENYILAADITHKVWNDPADWVYNPKPSIFDMAEINRIKQEIIAPVQKLISIFHGRKTVNTICRSFCDWLNELNICDTINAKIHMLEDNPEAADSLRRVWGSFVSVINQISDCLGGSFATFTEFYELFSSCLSELSVGIVPPTRDKVVISEISRFRSTGAKVVLVLGVLDSSFPKSHNSEGILSDAERLYLQDMGLVLAPDCYSRQKEEQFLVYSVLSTATSELYLYSPVSDKEGKSLGNSEIFKRLKLIFPDIKIESEDDELDRIEGRDHTFFELCARLFECGWDIKQLSTLWKAVYNCFENDIEYAKRLEHFKAMYRNDSEPPMISKALARKLYGSPLSLSVSKLEKYNSCAFSFFMRYGLLAEERLLGGLKPADTGSILHDVLCRYFKDKAECSSDYSQISREECQRDINRLVNDFAQSSDNALFVSSNYYGYMLMRLKNIASSTAWKLIRFYSQSSFRPCGFEVSFGKGKELPAYVLETKDGQVVLKGFIDRVDSACINGQSYITVTDYKSSEKRIDAEMIDAGITIQPLIYANAVAKSQSDTKPAAMMYLQMNDPIAKFDLEPTDEELEAEMNKGIKAHGIFLDEPEVIAALDKNADDKNAIHYISCDKKSRFIKEIFEKRLSDAEKCAVHTAEKISDGIIDVNPPDISGFDPCRYCPYGNICKDDQ